jgi:23S rRNA (cytidine2498-2'-O)-methyltransferase
MDRAFLYCACQVGAEAALKREVVALDPSLRPAFARPGLVTFKLSAPEGLEEAEARAAAITSGAVLARACGVSFGPVDPGAPGALDAAISTIRAARPAGAAIRLQAWERDRWRPGEEPAGFVYGVAAAAARAELLARWPGDLERLAGERAAAGDWVVDVIVGEAGEPWLLGAHRPRGVRVGDGGSPFPGARVPVTEEPAAPSRAYYKLEEAIVAADLPLRPGDVAVELGSAPGGASYALLRRGLAVHGVDPGAMDPLVLDYPGGADGPRRFTHHACTMGQVHRGDLPRDLHWVIADVNLAPQIALQTVRRLAARPRAALQGIVVTLKLDDWRALRHLPRWRRQIEAMGMVEVGVQQLSSNRMELFSYGLTRAGVARRGAGAAGSPKRTGRPSPSRRGGRRR